MLPRVSGLQLGRRQLRCAARPVGRAPASEKWALEPCPEVEGLSRTARKRHRRKPGFIQQRLEESWAANWGKPRPLGGGDGVEKAAKKDERTNLPTQGGSLGGWPSARGECKRPSRDADKDVDSGRRQSVNGDCNGADVGEQIAPVIALKTSPMPATKFCPNYADLRNYKIPKIKRSEQSGEVVLNRTEEQSNRSPVKSAPVQQCRKPQTSTPEKATTAGRPQKLRSPQSSLGGKSSGKGLMDQIMDEMDKSYPKVTGIHPKSTFPASSRRDSGTPDPASHRSPAKRLLAQDSSSSNANGTAPTPPPEKKSSFGAPFPRSWEEPRELCIVCHRRSVSDSGLRDTCIRCSFTQVYRDKQSREEGVAQDKPAAAAVQLPPCRPPEPSPAKPSSRRGSSDVENRRERIVRSKQDGGVSRLDGSGTETTDSSSPVKRHGCDRKKRAVRRTCRSKAVISSSDESSDADTDSRGAPPCSLEENRTVFAASSPRKGTLGGRARPAREPHLLREKNDNSDSASAVVRKAGEDKKAGSSSAAIKKKKQKGTVEGVMKRWKQRSAWKKAKDTAEYLEALGEFQGCEQPLELENTSHEQANEDAKDRAEDEEVESIEAVLACLRQSEREKLAKTASSDEAKANIPVPESDKVACGTSEIVANHLKQPLSPGLVVSSCRSLSMDDWENLEAQTDKHEDSAALHAEASIDVGTPAPNVISLSSDSSSSDVEVVGRTERLNCSFVRADLSSSVEVGDSSSDTSEETNAAVRLTGFSYEVSYNEDGVPCVRVRDTSSSEENQLSSSSDDDIAEITERDCGESLANTCSMAPDEAHGFNASVSSCHPVSLTGEDLTKEGLRGQSAVTPPASLRSMAEEGFREESAITSPVTAYGLEESASSAISHPVSLRGEDLTKEGLRAQSAVTPPASVRSMAEEGFHEESAIISPVTAPVLEEGANKAICHPVSLTGEGLTKEGLCAQSAVTPPASVRSMAEEGFCEESSITSPVTASVLEEGASSAISHPVSLRGEGLTKEGLCAQSAVIPPASVRSMAEEGFREESAIISPVTAPVLEEGANRAICHPVSLTGEGITKEGLRAQSAVTPPASVHSMAEEGFREESSITSPVTASVLEEGTNREILWEGTANSAAHADSAVAAFPHSSPPAADVQPGKETPLPVSFPQPNQEPLPVGDQTWSLPASASELGLTIEEEARGSTSLRCEDRSLVVQQRRLPATTANTSSPNNDSSAEWDPLRAVDELFPDETYGTGSPEISCRVEQLEGIMREYVTHIERFLAAFGSSTPEVQAALFDGLIAEGGFAKLVRAMQLLWDSQATGNCVSRERVMALQDAMCSVFAKNIARLGPASMECDLPPDLSFEPLPPEAVQQQLASPLGTEMGPSGDQVGEVDTGPCNSVDASEVRPDSAVASETTGRPEPGRTPAAMAVAVPVAEDGATAENRLSDTRPSSVVGGVSADPTEARRTPVTVAAAPVASPRMPEPVGTAVTAQVAESLKPPLPSVHVSTWHPPVVRQAVRANASGVGLVQVPAANHRLEAAPDTRIVGINGDTPSKVLLPSPAGSNGSACTKVLLQPRSTNHNPGARVPTQNPPPPPPLQKGRVADGAPQGANGTPVRSELRDPPPLQRAPDSSTMSQEQLQELQYQLVAYLYVTNMLNARMNAGGRPPTLVPRPPQSSPQQSQPLNQAQLQPENAAASLKRMPPLQYMPLRAQPSAAAGTRPSNNQPLPQKPQSSQESPPRMPHLIRPSLANQLAAGAEERSQGPPANRELPVGEATALTQAQAQLQFELQRRRQYELLFYKLALSPEGRQQMQRILQNVLAARDGVPTGRSAPASEARPEIMGSSFQQQSGLSEQSSSGPSLTGVTVPNGSAPKSHTIAVARAENGSSQRGTQLVRPWCDQPQQQQPQWPYPYGACQEALLRYKQQQQQSSTEAASGAAAESNYPSSTLRPSSTWGPPSGQQSQALNQPTVVRSPPEQGQAASTLDSLQGRNGALHAVPPNQYTAYQRFLEHRQGSGSLLIRHAGVHVASTPGVSRPPTEGPATPRATPQTPRRVGKAPPPEARSPR